MQSFEFRLYREEFTGYTYWQVDVKNKHPDSFFGLIKGHTTWRFIALDYNKLAVLEKTKKWIEETEARKKAERAKEDGSAYTYFSTATLDQLIAEEKAKTNG